MNFFRPDLFKDFAEDAIGGINNDNTWNFNGQWYYIGIQLSNGTTQLPIHPASIISLSITESIYSIFSSIELVLDSSSNMIDNAVMNMDNQLKERVFSQSFNFSADSNEQFFIAITPIDADKNPLPTKYAIYGTYYIYDEDEALLGKGSEKQKIFYLRDVREQKLLQSNLQWSTTKVLRSTEKYNYSLAHVGNSNRQVKTGTAIKHLLSTVLDTPQMRNENKGIDPDWNEGETAVYYSSPCQSTAYDDLEYLLDRHISTGQLDNCILKSERNHNFSLRSVENYFALGHIKDDIAPLICDAFVGESGNFNTSKDPDVVGNVIPSHAFTENDLLKFDGLDSFSLLHVANTDSNNELISNIVHSIDQSSKNNIGQFNIECDKHHITNVKSKMQDLYANKMPGSTGDMKASAILPINERKFDNMMVNHSTGPSGTTNQRLHAGINNTLRKALYFSPSINIEVPGMSHRTTCRFILLSLRNADKDAPLTKLLVGEWFISKINHAFIFPKNAYINNISCIKPHASEELSDLNINKENLNQAIDREEIGAPAGATDLDTLNLQEGEDIV